MEVMKCWQPIPINMQWGGLCAHEHLMQGLMQRHPRPHAEGQVPPPLLGQTLSPPLSLEPIHPQRLQLFCCF
eukprot:1137003-Pelagomonas_calceolata.AAC.3